MQSGNEKYYQSVGKGFCRIKNLPASRAHSHRALRAQLASLSTLRARDLIVALRAPFFLDLALRARSCASNQFYNNITDDVNYTFS